MNPKLQARVAHVVNGKAADQRPAYYDLIKPQSERPVQINGDEGDSLGAAPLESSEVKGIEAGGKEEVWVHKAHVSPFSKNHPNPSPTDLPARKKHDAVLP